MFHIHERAPKSKNFVKFEANDFFDPQLSVDNEDSKKRLNEEVGEIGLFGVGAFRINHQFFGYWHTNRQRKEVKA